MMEEEHRVETYARRVPVAIAISIAVQVFKKLVGITSRRASN
jgi:hypothetical protein